MKKMSKMQILAWILAFVPIVLTACVYSRLPRQVPMHWDLAGAVTYEPKWQLWIVTSLPLLFAVIFPLLPRLDPKHKNYSKFRSSYDIFQILIMLFILVITLVCLTESLYPGTLNVAALVCILCSLLYIFLGNMMPKFRSNWFFGIKTPWTISSETVWSRTHRLAGRLVFTAGFIGLAGAFVPHNAARFALLFAPLMISVIVPIIMSYLWYRQESQERSNE